MPASTPPEVPPMPPKLPRPPGPARKRMRRRAKEGDGNAQRTFTVAELRKQRVQQLQKHYQGRVEVHKWRKAQKEERERKKKKQEKKRRREEEQMRLQRKKQRREEEQKRQKQEAHERKERKVQERRPKLKKSPYIIDEAEEEGVSEPDGPDYEGGSEADESDFVDDSPVAQALASMMSSTRVRPGASKYELYEQSRRPPTFAETTAEALRCFTPTIGIRHREDRLPEVTDSQRRRKMERFGLIEKA
ncbi:hypothetical protein OC834_006816 [Tilletia horrida]|nr:hypothetical protein OC834_006816 [Tilletia horrida]